MVNRSPEVMGFAVHSHEYLIEMSSPLRQIPHQPCAFLCHFCRSDSGKRIYLMTARRITSGEVL